MRLKVMAIGGAVLAFLTVGAIGVFRYADTFWLYRGFPPPSVPKAVAVTRGGVTSRVSVSPGTTETFTLASPALGGRSQVVYVFLPPGYFTDPTKHYPVLYLLHGHPGGPLNFLLAGRIGALESVLVARRRMTPMILVMPYGSTGFLGPDEEWANGVRPHEGWETYLARDVVRAVDAGYRTIPAGWARALVGLSEGGYGALNIGVHHPGEFRVLESWSGYVRAANIASIFGGREALLRWNSPALTLPAAARALRAAHTFVWFYSGSIDGLLRQNEQFERELAQLGISSHFSVLRGGHDWALWRGDAANALLAASEHLVPPRAPAGARHVPGTGGAGQSHG